LLKKAFQEDSNLQVRNQVKNVMATIVARGGLNIWKDLLPYLADNLKCTDRVEDSIHAISMVVEDCQNLLGENSYS
jgi:hypothetical protein